MQKSVRVIVPYKGESSRHTLDKLARAGFLEKDKADAISRAISNESKIAKQEARGLRLGIEIISTGKTANGKGLCALKPVLSSETVAIVNERRYNEDERIYKVLERLDPQFYFDEGRVRAYKKWHDTLERNLKTWLPETKDAAGMFLDGHNYGQKGISRNDLWMAGALLPRKGEPFYGLPSTYRKLSIDECANILGAKGNSF